MVAHGRVRNGVVVLDEGVSLPEGQAVTVVVPDLSAALSRGKGPHSVLDIPPVSVGAVLRREGVSSFPRHFLSIMN
jgi:hypothetical protein